MVSRTRGSGVVSLRFLRANCLLERLLRFFAFAGEGEGVARQPTSETRPPTSETRPPTSETEVPISGTP
jgi:hypothetical protein